MNINVLEKEKETVFIASWVIVDCQLINQLQPAAASIYTVGYMYGEVWECTVGGIVRLDSESVQWDVHIVRLKSVWWDV